MKFSYPLIREFVPKLKSKKQLIEALSAYAFEAEDAGKNILEVKLLNRAGDAASHQGIAREAAAALGVRHTVPEITECRPLAKRQADSFSVRIDEPTLCSRYTAQRFDGVRVGSSPSRIARVLEDCGLRPLNNVVDAMNYVMLEVGQPLHAFDLDKVEGNRIIVRKAKKGERIITLDGNEYELDTTMLVIADMKKPLALAGIKGGVAAAVTERTTRILVEAATFDPVNIYKTSKALKLSTDASFRFSHNLHPAFAAAGLRRAGELLVDLVGVRPTGIFDSLEEPLPSRKLVFDTGQFERLIGIPVPLERSRALLERLGFVTEKEGTATSFMVTVPVVRQDIENDADLAEEVARLTGYGALPSIAPRVDIVPAFEDESILVKDKTRSIFGGLGFDEVYNHSLVSFSDLKRIGAEELAIELENPLSSEFRYLRPILAPHLLHNAEDNGRFFDHFGIFEIGRVFYAEKRRFQERTLVSVLGADKHGETFFFLKGALERFLRSMGIVDYAFVPKRPTFSHALPFPVKHLAPRTLLWIVSSGKIIGSLGKISGESDQRLTLAELDLGEIQALAAGEREYAPLPKYPAVMRDVSVVLGTDLKIGEVIEAVQHVDARLIQDVDLVDEYIKKGWQNEQSIALRIVFQASDRTLTSGEVDVLMKKITGVLESRFSARVR